MRLTLYIFLLFTLFVVEGMSQTSSGLVAYYSFDNCDATDDTGMGADGVIGGNPSCDCGVSGEALVLDGQNDFLQFLGSFEIIFTDDFTVSIYIRPDVIDNSLMDLISKREACALDTSFSLRVNPGSRVFSTELAESPAAFTNSAGELSDMKCWHHLAFVRRVNESALYYNGALVSSVFSPFQIALDNNGIFSIADSPCLMNGEQRFAGGIDELRLYNRALTAEEIAGLYIPTDEIQNRRDTILFKGDCVPARIGNSCASGYNWFPATGVSQTDISNPMLCPEVTTTYTATMNYGICSATDTIHINVVDPSEFACDRVFLPNAFTPNGDMINDEYGISNVVFLGDLKSFEIFDRWGGRVFSTQNPDETWDGRLNGKDMMPGMYIYKLRFSCDTEELSKAGSFTLIR